MFTLKMGKFKNLQGNGTMIVEGINKWKGLMEMGNG